MHGGAFLIRIVSLFTFYCKVGDKSGDKSYISFFFSSLPWLSAFCPPLRPMESRLVGDSFSGGIGSSSREGSKEKTEL